MSPESPSLFPGASASELGLGCVTFGREIDQPAAFTMMERALESGITFFDTAAAYGSGASEAIVGAWIARRGVRTRIRLATKILPPYEPSGIATAVDVSLRRLGVDYVDLLFLHRWETSVVDPSVLRAMDGVVRSGRVRALGASNFTAAQLAAA